MKTKQKHQIHDQQLLSLASTQSVTKVKRQKTNLEKIFIDQKISSLVAIILFCFIITPFVINYSTTKTQNQSPTSVYKNQPTRTINPLQSSQKNQHQQLHTIQQNQPNTKVTTLNNIKKSDSIQNQPQLENQVDNKINIKIDHQINNQVDNKPNTKVNNKVVDKVDNKVDNKANSAKSIKKQINANVMPNKINTQKHINQTQIQKKNHLILGQQLGKFYKQKGNITIGDIGSENCYQTILLSQNGFKIQSYDNIQRKNQFSKNVNIVDLFTIQNFNKQYNWVQSLYVDKYIYKPGIKTTYTQSQIFFTNIYKHAKNGIILRWKTPLDWRIEEMSQFLEKFGFIYNSQLSSLFKSKLIDSPQDHIIIFEKKIPPPSPNFRIPNSKSAAPKISLGIFTIFIMDQNIPFLRQWLIYNIRLGVDKFYLYDNTGSIGRNGATKTVNKYGFQFRKLINSTDQQLQDQWKDILKNYGKYIVYQKWQPKNQKGEITYNHSLGIKHYLNNHGHQVNFTAFIDIDEFIFTQKGKNLKAYIHQKRLAGVTKLILKQKKFKDRYCSPDSKVSTIAQSFQFDTSHWDPKLIVQTNVTIVGIMHWLKIKQGLAYDVPPDEFRFNHYNTNLGTWVRYKKFHQLTQDQIQVLKKIILYKKDSDNSMAKYNRVIDKECKGKCSDSNILIKFPQQELFNRLCGFKYQIA